MRKAIVLFSLLICLRALGTIPASAQEKSHITVRGNDLNNGVAIMAIQKAGKEYQLQCNEGASSCATLRNGNYQMVELPRGFGLYECRDVEVFAESAGAPDNAPDKDRRLGEYCLIEK